MLEKPAQDTLFWSHPGPQPFRILRCSSQRGTYKYALFSDVRSLKFASQSGVYPLIREYFDTVFSFVGLTTGSSTANIV